MPAQNSYTTKTPADGDYVTGVDISDTTQSASGSTASFLFSAIYTYVRGKLLAAANTWTQAQAIGPDASPNDPSYDALLAIDDYTFEPRTSQINGLQMNVTLDGAVGGQFSGLNFYIDSGESTGDLTSILGVNGSAWHGTAGDVGYVIGAQVNAGSYGAGDVAHLVGLRAVLYSNGTTQEAVGLLVDDVSGADTNYAIKTGVGAVSFGDDVEIDGALTVGGSAVPTAAEAVAYALIFG